MKFAEFLGKNIQRKDYTGRGWDPLIHDMITFGTGNHALMGVILGESALLVHWKNFQSWRIRRGNLGFSRDVKLFKSKVDIDRALLNKYFEENEDNPYGVYHVVSNIHYGRSLKGLTQFPPLALRKYSNEEFHNRIDALIAIAKPGDIVFSRPPSSPVSSLIRKEDHSPFSHVAGYLGKGETFDSTPNGVQITKLHDNENGTHFALYTLRGEITDQQRNKMVEYGKLVASKKSSYAYDKVFYVWLRKKLGMSPHSKMPSISDLLYSANFQLVFYV